MKREDTYAVRVAINGSDAGVWDKMTGGEVTAESSKFRPGALATEITLGSTRSVDNVTVSHLNDEFIQSSVHDWSSGTGRYDAVVTKQPLDPDGNAYGRPIIYSGKVVGVKAPDVDSESSDAALCEVEIECHGVIA